MERSAFSHCIEAPVLDNLIRSNCLGVNLRQALQNIRIRCEERKEGRRSSLKTALVLQGGAMRGVYSAGVCCALQEIGYTEGFDEVYGVSGGALNGAYFLSGQAAYGATVYYQNINNREFINFLRTKKIVDIDFLIDITRNVKPLNVKKLYSSSTQLNIFLTEALTGKVVKFTSKPENTDIFRVFNATAAMPFVYDRPVTIGDTDYLDGGISCPIPVTQAIDGGCTDIFVVLTKPKHYRPKPPSGVLHNFVIAPRIKKHGRGFYEAFMNKYVVETEQLCIVRGEKDYHEKQVNIVALSPGKSLNLKRTTKSARLLKNAAIEGAVNTLRLFGVERYHPVEVLKFLNF